MLRDGHGHFAKGTEAPARRRCGAVAGNFGGVKYPWLVFWKRRALRPEDKWVRTIVSDHAGSVLSDKPDASEAEKHVIEVGAIARGCTALILDAMRRAGGVETEGGLALVRELRGFLSLEQKALLALGLGRRARPVDPLQAVRDAVERASQDADAERAAREEERDPE